MPPLEEHSYFQNEFFAQFDKFSSLFQEVYKDDFQFRFAAQTDAPTSLEQNFEKCVEKLQKFSHILKEHKRKKELSKLENVPNEIMLKVFSYLTYSELCTVELVSKKWNLLAKQTWSIKNKLVFAPRTVYGLSNNHENCKRICYLKLFDGLINKKLDPSNLKSLDLSSIVMLSNEHLQKILGLVEEKCANLSSLKLMPFKMLDDRLVFEQYLQSKSTANLKSLTLCESLVDDTFLGLIFENCKQLRSFKISEFAQTRLTGECFQKINASLSKASFMSCFKIERKQFIALFQRCRHISELSISEPPPDILLPIIDNLTSIKKLCIAIRDCDEHQFRHLRRLKLLTSVRLFDKTEHEETLGNFFSNCVALRHAEIIKYSYAKKKLKFNEFNAPLESFSFVDFRELHLDNLSFFNALKKCSQTLKHLDIGNCESLPSMQIIDLIQHCRYLNHLKLNGTNVCNLILEKAYELSCDQNTRTIFIECWLTNCKCEEFLASSKCEDAYTFRRVCSIKNFSIENLYEICVKNNLTFVIDIENETKKKMK